MSRAARIVIPGIPHHITQRGNRRQPVFFEDDDYELYKSLMKEWCDRLGVEIWAYCLMSNHIHLVAVPERAESLARAIGEAHRRYTAEINRRKGWTGHLWQGRFSSFAMDEAYTLNAVRYVERNPVEAKMVKQADKYLWSSAAAHMKGRNDGLVKVKPMRERVDDWRLFLHADMTDDFDEKLSYHSSSGWPLGNDEFLKALEEKTGLMVKPRRRGRPVKKNGAGRGI